jgi:hypothetical protein
MWDEEAGQDEGEAGELPCAERLRGEHRAEQDTGDRVEQPDGPDRPRTAGPGWWR